MPRLHGNRDDLQDSLESPCLLRSIRPDHYRYNVEGFEEVTNQP